MKIPAIHAVAALALASAAGGAWAQAEAQPGTPSAPAEVYQPTLPADRPAMGTAPADKPPSAPASAPTPKTIDPAPVPRDPGDRSDKQAG